MDKKKRIEIKAEELGIEWEKVATSGWSKSNEFRLSTVFEKWYDDIIEPIHRKFPTYTIPNKTVKEYFQKWFLAPPGTDPEPPILE